jgi:hypothetical protein
MQNLVTAATFDVQSGNEFNGLQQYSLRKRIFKEQGTSAQEQGNLAKIFNQQFSGRLVGRKRPFFAHLF